MNEFKIKYHCSLCRREVNSPGYCLSCSMLSDYEKGKEAGRQKARREAGIGCFECGKSIGHHTWCSSYPKPIKLRNTYEEGFDEEYNKLKKGFSPLNRELPAIY